MSFEAMGPKCLLLWHTLVDQLANASKDDAHEGGQNDQVHFYGWPELQVGIVREALAVAEALPGTSLWLQPSVDIVHCVIRSISGCTDFVFSLTIPVHCAEQ